MCRIKLIFTLLLLLGACASGPAFDTQRVDHSLTPRSVVAELPVNMGKRVLWGGVILNTTNLKDSTQIEVLAYPLDSDNVPKRDRDPLGRFILERAGYLEPTRYAEGRLITLVGAVARNLNSQVGESAYTYPVITAEQVHLWPTDRDRDRSNVHFGIGVGIGL